MVFLMRYMVHKNNANLHEANVPIFRLVQHPPILICGLGEGNIWSETMLRYVYSNRPYSMRWCVLCCFHWGQWPTSCFFYDIQGNCTIELKSFLWSKTMNVHFCSLFAWFRRGTSSPITFSFDYVWMHIRSENFLLSNFIAFWEYCRQTFPSFKGNPNREKLESIEDCWRIILYNWWQWVCSYGWHHFCNHLH